MSKENHKTQIDLNIKAYMQTNDYKMKNEQLKKDINKHKINIDRSCFKKSKDEKQFSKEAKLLYKREYLNKGYKPEKITIK